MAKERKYGKWGEEDMDRAMTAFRNGDAGLNEVARIYNVPKATLRRRLLGTNVYAKGSEQRFGRCTDLDSEMEKDLVSHILELESHLFGITRADLQILAFEIAKANGIPNRFKHGKAGKKWYYGFMARHPELSLRQPEATSAARALGFSRERVNEFFDVLTRLLDKYQFPPTNIFNMDESGFSTVQRPQKILAQRGKHQVGALTSGERGTNTTCVCCMSATGMYVPPMLIFKRLRFKDELNTGAPPGAICTCSESGWITSELFLKWLQHFIAIVRPSTNNKVLLILDGHSTHTKNLEAITLARENGVVMLSLPAHTTHRLQPCDVSFFKPFSSYYNQAPDKWLRSNPSRNITQFQVSALIGEAYGKAATVVNAMSGFAKTGIWPLDRNVFQDSDFAPTAVNHENEPNTSLPKSPSQNPVPSSQSSNTSEDISTANPLCPEKSPNIARHKPVAEISPIPELTRSRKQKTTSVAVITSSPYKNELEEKQSKKVAGRPTSTPKNKPLKRKLQYGKPEKEGKDWYCKICEMSEMIDMIQCMRCKIWLHQKCANVSAKRKVFYCEDCA